MSSAHFFLCLAVVLPGLLDARYIRTLRPLRTFNPTGLTLSMPAQTASTVQTVQTGATNMGMNMGTNLGSFGGPNTLFLVDAPDLPDNYFYYPGTLGANTAAAATTTNTAAVTNVGTVTPLFTAEATNIVATPVASLGTAVRGVQTLGTAMPMDGTYYATAANGRIAYEVTRDGSDLSFDRLNPY